MTGYCALQRNAGGHAVKLEIKAVNNRFLEIAVHAPAWLNPWEAAVRERITAVAARGKVDLFVDVRPAAGLREPAVDEKLARRWQAALERVRRAVKSAEPVPLAAVLAAEGVVGGKEESDPARSWAVLEPLLAPLLEKFDKVRAHDGASAARDLAATCKRMRRLAAEIAKLSAGSATDLRAELERRLARVTAGRVDEQLVLSEAAILATRTDVNEELARLGSHLDLFDKTLAEKVPVGKTLDFICQEMGREVNTIGSKQQRIEISSRVIALKGELEKLREQARNVE